MVHWICLILESIYQHFFFLTRLWTTANCSFLSSSSLARDHHLPSPSCTCSSITQTLWPITHRKPQYISLPAPRDSGTHLPHCFRRCFAFASNSSLLKLTELITCAEHLSTCNKINFNSLIYSLYLQASEFNCYCNLLFLPLLLFLAPHIYL